MDSVPVSVVIPAYNEAMRLPGSLPSLVSVMRGIPGAEVIVVDDGSTDGTCAVAEEHLAELPGGRVLRLPWNSGKGAAVRAGVSVSRGASIVFVDADGASDARDLPLLLAALEHAEIALGSRRIGGGAVRTNGRRVGSWAFNQITRSLASLDVADTQCGFKAFRGPEAKLLFSLARSTGFGFDVEVLSIARSIGYRIAEVPVRWAEIPGGTFRVARHTPAMIVDVVRARRYLSRSAPGPVVGRGPVAPGGLSAAATAAAAVTPAVEAVPATPADPAPRAPRTVAPSPRIPLPASPRGPLSPPRVPRRDETPVPVARVTDLADVSVSVPRPAGQAEDAGRRLAASGRDQALDPVLAAALGRFLAAGAAPPVLRAGMGPDGHSHSSS
ncbi:dolichyl-phosphate beta-glucosyltransferase [Frankia sp. AgKG'84/4]